MNEEEQRALNALYRYCQIGRNTEPWSDGKGRFLLEHERNSKRSSTSDDSEKMHFKQTRALVVAGCNDFASTLSLANQCGLAATYMFRRISV